MKPDLSQLFRKVTIVGKKVRRFFLVSLALFLVLFVSGCYHPVDEKKSKNYYYNSLKTEIRYIPLGNSFELGNTKVDGVNLETFQVIAEEYAKDKNNVYFQHEKIEGADPSSFSHVCNLAVNGFLYADKNNLYYNQVRFKSFNVKTIRFFGNESCSVYLGDDDRVYYAGVGYDLKPIQPIPKADPETFKAYALGDNSVYSDYAKDKNYVFYDGKILNGADTNTFEELSPHIYFKDSRSVYCNGKVLENVAPENFTRINNSCYATDKKRVYYYCKLIVEADPETFVAIENTGGQCYAKDKNHNFIAGSIQK